MPIVVDGKGEFEKPDVGLHNAVCTGVVDLGMQTDEFKGKKTTKRKIMLLWEIDQEMTEGEYAGNRFLMFKEYTASLVDRANLRKDLASWRGRDFTNEELEGFDIEVLAGKPCTIGIIYNDSGRAKVDSVSPPMKGADKLTPQRPGYIPEWIKEKINVEKEEDHTDDPDGGPIPEDDKPTDGELGYF